MVATAWITDAGAQGLTVNGVDISTLATLNSSFADFQTMSPRRGKDYIVPGRHGILVVPSKKFDSTTFDLPLLVKGCRADGTIPSGSSAQKEFYARVDELARLFQKGDTVTIGHVLPDGSTRVVDAVVYGTSNFSRNMGFRPLVGRVTITMLPVSPFWADLNPVTPNSASLLTGQTLNLTNFEGATAPIADLVVTFGPGNNPSIIQGVNSFQYAGVIGAGQQLVVDFGNFTLDKGTGSAWTPDYSKIVYTQQGAWFQFEPTTEPLSLTLTHTTGSGVSMSISVAGKRKYFAG